MQAIFISVFEETLQVTLFVLLMMVAVDALNVWTRGKIAHILRKENKGRQYFVASLIGTMPGCLGGFTNVSLYIHGMISFGALAGGMVASSGDEAFVMLALFPRTALLLFGILFVYGIVSGRLIDWFIKRWNIKTCGDCTTELLHPSEKGFRHFIVEHVWDHIIRRHLWKTALWTFGALLLVKFGMQYWNLESLGSTYTFGLLLLSVLLGLIPESGPHMIFVSLFANGLIPFSVLLTSSIVQDGHGMLPMFSYSVKDSLKLKGFNAAFGFLLGLLLYSFEL